MNAAASIDVRVATEPWEFDAIHALNHATFAGEIPQHAPSPDGRLVDRFHLENIYLIATSGSRLVGMLALRNRRPFSLDAKVPDLDRHLPAGRSVVEVRLLAVARDFRCTAVFPTLFRFAVQRCRAAGHDLAVISGTTRQLKLYRHLGFIPFGPLVGRPGAQFQPMFLTLENFAAVARHSRALQPRPMRRGAPLNLLPGPVATAPEVDAAFAAPAISHRSPEFIAGLRRVRTRLCGLTGARDVQVMPGSGSLANAVVAAQLSLRATRGLVVANGEFGERLLGEARRARLDFSCLQAPWGAPLDLAQLARAAEALPPGGWIWFVHHETSTGMLNPLEAIKRLAASRGLFLCVDCISSIGSVPVDLAGVHLASGTSGKGLGSYPGLALVFHDHTPKPEPERLPGYLDLGHWLAHDSVPHTHSSNLVRALETALDEVSPRRMARLRRKSIRLRRALLAAGFACIGPDDMPPSGVVTFAVGDEISAGRLGEELEALGYLLNFRSGHLLSRNWLQVSLLGDPPAPELARFLETLSWLRAQGRRGAATPDRFGHGEGRRHAPDGSGPRIAGPGAAAPRDDLPAAPLAGSMASIKFIN